MALGLYTVLPGFARWEDRLRSLLAPMLPIVGVVVGILWWCIASLSMRFVPNAIGAVLIAVTPSICTGFLHLDGYMDVSDALLSSRPRQDKLRILKDPHTGSFSVITLCILLAISIAAAYTAMDAAKHMVALLFLPVVSRSLAALAVLTITPLAQSMYGRMHYDTASPGSKVWCLLCLLAACMVAFIVDWRIGCVVIAQMAAFGTACAVAMRSLGGMNGDISGFSISCAEAVGLIVFACI